MSAELMTRFHSLDLEGTGNDSFLAFMNKIPRRKQRGIYPERIKRVIQINNHLAKEGE